MKYAAALLLAALAACSPHKEAVHMDEKLKKLTPLQLNVTKSCGTEPAFHNEYWDNHRAGIYVDVISGEPLFLSSDKFDSGSGWPSFTRPAAGAKVETRSDASLGMRRTEVRPMFRRRAISALLTPARWSLRISGDLTAAVAGRPSRLPFSRAYLIFISPSAIIAFR